MYVRSPYVSSSDCLSLNISHTAYIIKDCVKLGKNKLEVIVGVVCALRRRIIRHTVVDQLAPNSVQQFRLTPGKVGDVQLRAELYAFSHVSTVYRRTVTGRCTCKLRSQYGGILVAKDNEQMVN